MELIKRPTDPKHNEIKIKKFPVSFLKNTNNCENYYSKINESNNNDDHK